MKLKEIRDFGDWFSKQGEPRRTEPEEKPAAAPSPAPQSSTGWKDDNGRLRYEGESKAYNLEKVDDYEWNMECEVLSSGRFLTDENWEGPDAKHDIIEHMKEIGLPVPTDEEFKVVGL